MLRLMVRPVRAHASGVATRVTQRGCVRAVDEDDGPAMSFYHLVADATLDGVQVSHLARARAPRYGYGPCRGCARARRRCSTSSRTCIIPSSRRTARSALRPTPHPALPPALCAPASPWSARRAQSGVLSFGMGAAHQFVLNKQAPNK